MKPQRKWRFMLAGAWCQLGGQYTTSSSHRLYSAMVCSSANLPGPGLSQVWSQLSVP